MFRCFCANIVPLALTSSNHPCLHAGIDLKTIVSSGSSLPLFLAVSQLLTYRVIISKTPPPQPSSPPSHPLKLLPQRITNLRRLRRRQPPLAASRPKTCITATPTGLAIAEQSLRIAPSVLYYSVRVPRLPSACSVSNFVLWEDGILARLLRSAIFVSRVVQRGYGFFGKRDRSSSGA